MKKTLRGFVAALLLVTPLLISCGEVADTISAPAGSQPQNGLISGLLGAATDLVGGVVGLVVGGEDANAAKVSKWIGWEGGTIKTGAYTLIVPQGAVSQNTLFEVAPSNDGSYSLELNATQKSGSGRRKSYDTFNKPLTFVISYAGADNVADPSKLAMVYVLPGGGTEPQVTAVDTTARTATCQMHHFSKYALVQN